MAEANVRRRARAAPRPTRQPAASRPALARRRVRPPPFCGRGPRGLGFPV